MSFQQKAQPFLKQRKLLDSSKLKLFADDNFEFEENAKNAVEEGEIARYQHFSFFPQCFQKTCSADT